MIERYVRGDLTRKVSMTVEQLCGSALMRKSTALAERATDGTQAHGVKVGDQHKGRSSHAGRVTWAARRSILQNIQHLTALAGQEYARMRGEAELMERIINNVSAWTSSIQRGEFSCALYRAVSG
jgi:hypothetical protein